MLSSSTKLNMKERIVACIVKPGEEGDTQYRRSGMEGGRGRAEEWGEGGRQVGRLEGRGGGGGTWRQGGKGELKGEWEGGPEGGRGVKVKEVTDWLCGKCQSLLQTHAA